MDYQQLIDSLSPDVVERLRRGVETGRWPDGRILTPEQREHSLQAIIAWDQRHAAAEDRVGYIDKGRKAEKGRGRNSDRSGDNGDGNGTGNDSERLRWVDDGGEA